MKTRCIFLLLFAYSLNAQDISSGLIASYQLNGDLLDSSNSGHDARSLGVINYVQDRFGNKNSALSFTESSFHQVYYDGIDLVNSSMTFSFWYKKSRDPMDTWIMHLGTEGAFGKAVHVAVDYPQDLRFSFYYNDLDFTASPEQTTGEWYYFAATYDIVTGQRNMYVNGVVVASDIALVGFSGDTHFGFGINGITLDDFRIYNRALTGSEVAVLYAIPEPSTYPAIAGLLVFAVIGLRRKRLTSR